MLTELYRKSRVNVMIHCKNAINAILQECDLEIVSEDGDYPYLYCIKTKEMRSLNPLIIDLLYSLRVDNEG